MLKMLSTCLASDEISRLSLMFECDNNTFINSYQSIIYSNFELSWLNCTSVVWKAKTMKVSITECWRYTIYMYMHSLFCCAYNIMCMLLHSHIIFYCARCRFFFFLSFLYFHFLIFVIERAMYRVPKGRNKDQYCGITDPYAKSLFCWPCFKTLQAPSVGVGAGEPGSLRKAWMTCQFYKLLASL